MKKKLSLQHIRVKSFVTEVNTRNVKGGGGVDETLYSCLAYVSCNILQCIKSANPRECL